MIQWICKSKRFKTPFLTDLLLQFYFLICVQLIKDFLHYSINDCILHRSDDYDGQDSDTKIPVAEDDEGYEEQDTPGRYDWKKKFHTYNISITCGL